MSRMLSSKRFIAAVVSLLLLLLIGSFFVPVLLGVRGVGEETVEIILPDFLRGKNLHNIKYQNYGSWSNFVIALNLVASGRAQLSDQFSFNKDPHMIDGRMSVDVVTSFQRRGCSSERHIEDAIILRVVDDSGEEFILFGRANVTASESYAQLLLFPGGNRERTEGNGKPEGGHSVNRK